MSPEKKDFVSEWVRTPRTAEEFAQNFEKSRLVHARPLTLAYHKLVESEGLNKTDLLCLGIGTAKVEEMMRLDSSRITAIEFNQSYITKAKNRLPAARFLQGRMEDLIDSIDPASVCLSQESLDCIPPALLPELVAKIRQKSGRLVAVQTYSPDPEFYGSSWIGADHAIGGIGIEGATIIQQQSLEDKLNNQGVQSTLGDPEQMLIELQRYIENIIGARFSINIVEALEYIGYSFTLLPDEAGLRSLPAQASLLLNHTELQVEHLKNALGRHLANRHREASLYISIDTTHRFLQLLLGTFRIDLFQQLLFEACQQAGYANVQLKSISASEKRTLDAPELIAQFNRSLDVIKKNPVFRRVRPDDKGSRAFIGSPIILMEPTNNPYSIARVPYLSAS